MYMQYDFYLIFCLISISNNSADNEEWWECFGCRGYSWSNAGAGSAVGKKQTKKWMENASPWYTQFHSCQTNKGMSIVGKKQTNKWMVNASPGYTHFHSCQINKCTTQVCLHSCPFICLLDAPKDLKKIEEIIHV